MGFVQSVVFAWVYLVAAVSLAFAFSSLFEGSAISILMSVILFLFVFGVIDTVSSSVVGQHRPSLTFKHLFYGLPLGFSREDRAGRGPHLLELLHGGLDEDPAVSFKPEVRPVRRAHDEGRAGGGRQGLEVRGDCLPRLQACDLGEEHLVLRLQLVSKCFSVPVGSRHVLGKFLLENLVKVGTGVNQS